MSTSYRVDKEGYTTVGELRRAFGEKVRGMVVRRHPPHGGGRHVLLDLGRVYGGIYVKCVGDGEVVNLDEIVDADDDDGKLGDTTLVKVEVKVE